MASPKQFLIHEGYDYRVLEVPGFQPIVFGCPPGLVKDFAKKKLRLPQHYVFPTQTVVRGVNIFDFEFVVYSFLFMQPHASRVAVYCTLDQRARFKSILTETLFGPSLDHLLQAQNHRWAEKQNFSGQERKRFNAFLRKISKNKKLAKLFAESLQSHISEKNSEKAVSQFLKELILKEKWLFERDGYQIAERLAASYRVCVQLKYEMSRFALVDEAGQDGFLDKVVDFRLFDKKDCVEIESESGKKACLKIKKENFTDFEIFKKNKKLGSLALNPGGDMLPTVKEPVIEKPFMGVSFLGVGSGFSRHRRNSCLIAWSEGKGMMVDSVSGQSQLLGQYGLDENDVRCVFLTHVHSDHDVGLLERILSGRRTQIISTRIIFESFLRKMEAVSGLPARIFDQFIDFVEVEAQKPKLLPGFKSTYFTFDYSFHSIPTGRFRLTYVDPQGNETVISHSGDSKFNEELVGEWYQQGKLSRKRRDDILGFIWDADLIIHDIGGGALHTKLSEIDGVRKSVRNKMVLVHQHEDPLSKSRFEFASEGQTKVVIKSGPNRKSNKRDDANSIRIELFEILLRSKIIEYCPGDVIYSNDGNGRIFYTVLEGEAELRIDGNVFTWYEKGHIFEEFYLENSREIKDVDCRAKSKLLMLEIPIGFYNKFTSYQMQKEYLELNRLMGDPAFSGLIACLTMGELIKWDGSTLDFLNRSENPGTHIVLSGKVMVKGQNGGGRLSLTTGDIFGDIQGLRVRPGSKNETIHSVLLQNTDLQGVFALVPSYKRWFDKKMRQVKSGIS